MGEFLAWKSEPENRVPNSQPRQQQRAGQREALVTAARRCAGSSELPAQVNLFANLEVGQVIDGEGRDLCQARTYASCNLSLSRSADSRFLEAVRLAITAHDCGTAAGEEQGGGPS